MTAGAMFMEHQAPGLPFLLLGWHQEPGIAPGAAFTASHPLTSGSQRLLPHFLRKKPKAGGRKRPQHGRDGRDGTGGRQHWELQGFGPSRPGGMGSARHLLCLHLWLWVQSSAQELDPDGRNVCR